MVPMAPVKPATVALLLLCLQWGGLNVAQAEDPSPAIYPGQANIALLMPLRTGGRNGSSGDAAGVSRGDAEACGSLDPRRVRLALAGVWAAQQANFRKAPSDFNLGVYLYDTCGRDEVALRQSVRVIHQAGHVRSMACPSTRVPPVFGAILQGELDAVETAAKTLASFSIPAVAARDVGADSVRRLRNLYSTAPSANSLARALASTLRRLGWSYVAVMSSPEDRPRELSRAFQKVARDMAIDIMSADAPPAGFSFAKVQESLGSTRQLVESGCRAAALFVTPAEAKAFLVSYEPDPDAAFSWVLVTPGDMTESLAGFLTPHKLRRLRHVLFAAPDDGQRPAEYGDYLRDLIDRDGSAPLLQELRKTYSRNDVVQRWDDEMSDSADTVAVIRAVWAMGAALRAVQRVQCGRGTDCLFGGRQGLSSSVLEALDSLNFNMAGSGVASLSDTPLRFSHDKHVATLKYAVKAVSTSGEVLQISSYTDDTGLEVDGILVPSRSPVLRGSALEAGRTSVKPSTRQRSSNLRSSNLEIHNEGEPQHLGDTTSSPPLSQTASDEDYGTPVEKASTAPGAVRLARPRLYSVWMAKPWTLAVVIMSGIGILLSAYVAVFLLMKLCEGVVRKGHQLTSLLLLLSVVSLFLSALLFTFRPRPKLCAAQQLLHHTSYAFAFGALLLKGMHLNAMQSAGLGGRASGLNQLLTICFLVAVQMALEAQAWMLSPPRWCRLNQSRFLLHQAYPCVVLALAVLMAFRTRNCSYHRRDARSLLCTSLLEVPILAAGHTAFLLLGPGEHQIAALSFALIATGFLILVGIFAPYLRALHKRGGYGHKPLSYSDSSASAFTTFQHHKENGAAIPECCYVRGGRAVTIVHPTRNGGPSHHVRNPLYMPGSAYP